MINNKQGKVKLGVLVQADIEAAEGTVTSRTEVVWWLIYSEANHKF